MSRRIKIQEICTGKCGAKEWLVKKIEITNVFKSKLYLSLLF